MKIDSLLDIKIDYSLLENIDKSLLFKYGFLPIYYEELFLVVAISNENSDMEKIIEIFNNPIKTIKVNKKELQFELEYLDLKKYLYELASKALKDNRNSSNSYIIEFLDKLLEFCIKNNVSDIHFECTEDSLLLRFRIDGVLNQFFRFDISLYPIISSIIKYFGNLDISQKRLPLNSRFTREVYGKKYDFRISTMPTIHGESIVLRILDNSNVKKKLKDIGFNKSTLNNIINRLKLKQGLILVTGPTGSGKTTSLYSMLNEIDLKKKKVITIEDPVEYKIDGIIQVNINHEIKLDYHLVLKNILRQDPDILMIGEIRDKESLQIAMQASLTGHLVIATLHTNGSIDTITRLHDLQAENYLIAATLKLVLSQRLLRVLCDKCKIKQEDKYIKDGCKECRFTGYKNRIVVSEILDIDSKIASMISKNKNTIDIQNYLNSINFKTLKQSAYELVQEGKTTLSEYYENI